MIKFRAWDKEEKEMIYDVQNTYDFTCNGSGAMEPSFKDVLEDKDRYEVMQFVNLHDFEDKELYTGDISRDKKRKGVCCLLWRRRILYVLGKGMELGDFKWRFSYTI